MDIFSNVHTCSCWKEAWEETIANLLYKNRFTVSKEYLTDWLRTDTNHTNNQHIYTNAATAKIV